MLTNLLRALTVKQPRQPLQPFKAENLRSMNRTASCLLLALLIGTASTLAADSPNGPWISLFNGRDLSGWKANVHPESFRVENGAIRAHSLKDRSHLFYADTGSNDFVRFKNFELRVTARGETNANSGIFFHTDYSVRDEVNHLARGYEVQLHTSPKEKKATGSLYDVVDIEKSPVDPSQWFEVYVRVEGKHIVIKLNGQTTVDYTEPENPVRSPQRKGRLLDPNGGGIALQAHDPGSVFYFKEILLRELP